jgi:hypothetical protein
MVRLHTSTGRVMRDSVYFLAKWEDLSELDKWRTETDYDKRKGLPAQKSLFLVDLLL